MTEEKKPDEAASNPENPPVADGASRRSFLKVGLVLGIVLTIGGLASAVKAFFAPANPPSPQAVQTTTPTVTRTVTRTVTGNATQASSTGSSTSQTESQSTDSTSTSASSPFPQVLVANASDLSDGKVVSFNYPLEEQPNILVKLGAKAKNGVGPDGDIVAFSQVCQHLGCIYAFVASGASPVCDNTYAASMPVGYCCCHGSIYDLTEGAKVIAGPAPRPVPQVVLAYDDSTGDIYATGMAPPTVFGFHTGSSNVLYDLQGGTPVS